MTFDSSIEYLKSIERAAYTPSHSNSVLLMQYLNDCQNTFPVVHVAGTNGKGSTIRFMKEMLIAAGYSIGTFVSPHYMSYLEMIEDNNQLIQEDDFTTSVSTVKDACDRLVADGHPHPTFYECITAVAFVHFANKEHDLVLVEALMGGRDDATNVFKQPLLSVITPISYDHEAFLGNSLSEIAHHKAGIIKKGTPVVLAPNPIEVLSVISSAVKENNGFLYVLDEGLIHTHTFVNNKTLKIFNLKTPFFEYKNIHTQMLGRHQEINMATAILAIKQLKYNFDVTDQAILEGIKKTTWSGRNEILSINPLILLDGGHNPSGIDALCSLIREHYSDYKLITVFGVLADKDHATMAKKLSNISQKMILTSPSSERSQDPYQIMIPDYDYSEVIEDIEKALERALSMSDETTLILVTGSLSLVQPAKLWLIDRLSL